MKVHLQDPLNRYPVCWGGHYKNITVAMTDDIDKVTCMTCLHLFASGSTT